MSLDFYLDCDYNAPKEQRSAIFIRRGGRIVEITEQEWQQMNPGIKPCKATTRKHTFRANITHNLGPMAKEAGLYDCLWKPNENGLHKAKDVLPHLAHGLANLLTEPERFKKLNPPNGWGDYDALVDFVIECLVACRKYPEAEVSVWS